MCDVGVGEGKVTSHKVVHWQLLVCSIKNLLILSTDFSSVIDTACIEFGAEPMT